MGSSLGSTASSPVSSTVSTTVSVGVHHLINDIFKVCFIKYVEHPTNIINSSTFFAPTKHNVRYIYIYLNMGAVVTDWWRMNIGLLHSNKTLTAMTPRHSIRITTLWSVQELPINSYLNWPYLQLWTNKHQQSNKFPVHQIPDEATGLLTNEVVKNDEIRYVNVRDRRCAFRRSSHTPNLESFLQQIDSAHLDRAFKPFSNIGL